MEKLQGINEFHNTQGFCYVSKSGDGWIASKRAIDRLLNKLCGLSDCKCASKLYIGNSQVFEATTMIENAIRFERIG